MRRLPILLALLCPTAGICADGGNEGAAGEAWYQVEVIVFADSRFDSSSEQWSKVEPRYPAHMVTIGTGEAQGPLPDTLWQLSDVLEYDTMFDTEGHEREGSSPVDEPELMFEQYSRGRRTGSTSRPDQDLIGGLTIEEPREEQSAAGEPALASGNAPNSAQPGTEAPLEEELSRAHIEELLEEHGPSPYHSVETGDRRLSAVNDRLRRSRNYRVLYHDAWRQPIAESESARPILIQGGERFDDRYELDGTITLSRSRYLHVTTDLWFTLFERVAPGQGALPSALHDLPMDQAELAQRYPALVQYESDRGSHIPRLTVELQQSRRMRSDTLHYIDHPAFGLLIEVTPLQEAVVSSIR